MNTSLKIERKVTFLASLGSVIEYYDFVVYGMMSKYLSAVFFPQNNENIALLQSFLVFAVGYFARPFGGIFAGAMGDRLGRKPAFLCLTMLMAACTLAIGFLPTYTRAGLLAPISLIILRLLQGLSFGGELPGATTIVAEVSLNKRRSLRQSFVVASVAMGALMATFVLFSLTHYLSESEITAWGWRVPFIFGGILGIFLFWIRQDLTETPDFLAEKQKPTFKMQKQKPVIELFQKHRASLITGILLTLFGASLIVVNLFFPYFISQYYHFAIKDVYCATTLSLIFSVVILPVTGNLADRLPKLFLLVGSCAAYVLMSGPLFHLLTHQDYVLLVLFMFIHQFFIALFCSCYFSIMIDLFPTSVRYSGIAICYSITYAVMGMLPAGLTTLLLNFQTLVCVPFVLSTMSALTGLACLSIWQSSKSQSAISLTANAN